METRGDKRKEKQDTAGREKTSEQQNKKRATLAGGPHVLHVSPALQLITAYTQPVGLGRPAILQAPLPGPDGNSS
jgi:acyl dehydratase